MSTMTDRDRVTVICPDCRTEREVSYSTAKEISNGGATGRCHPCGNAHRRATGPHQQHLPALLPDNWRDRAACLGIDPELFAPIGQAGTKAYEYASAPARAVCADCEVTRECLLDALRHDDRTTIRGGLDPAERRRQYGAGKAVAA